MLRGSPFFLPLLSPPDSVASGAALACGVNGGFSTAPGVLFGSFFGLDPLKRGKKPWIPFCFGVLFSPVDLMGFGCVPGCGVHKEKSGLKGAAWVDCITLSTSVSLVGGLEEQGGGFLLRPVDLMDFGSVPGCGVHKEKSGLKGAAWVDCITLSTSVSLIGGLGEQGGDFSLPGIGGFAGATEGRSSLFSVIFLSDAALLSALALASAFFCLGFRPAFFFGPVFCILISQFAKEQLISELVRLSKYLGPLPDGAPRTASILGSRYLLKYLSAEINPAEASCTRLY